MAYLLTSVSGNLISAASAGYAPTNSAEVSAIASAYQVVSATGTQLYAGTAHVTSINDTPISASRAGNAANASMATSAYYDGTGRLISSLPDSTTVSGIASAYVESGVSGKQDTLTFNYNTDNAISGINGSALAGGASVAPFPAPIKSGDTTYAVFTTGFQDNNSRRAALFISSDPAVSNNYPRMLVSENHTGANTTGKSSVYLADGFELYTGSGSGAGSKMFRADTGQVSASGRFALNSSTVSGYGWVLDRHNVSGSAGWRIFTGGVSGLDWKLGTAEYNYWNDKLDGSASSSFEPKITYAYNADNAISSINGSALAGQGGGGEYGSPSGTIIVSGSALEGTRSAIVSSIIPGINETADNITLPYDKTAFVWSGDATDQPATLTLDVVSQMTGAFVVSAISATDPVLRGTELFRTSYNDWNTRTASVNVEFPSGFSAVFISADLMNQVQVNNFLLSADSTTAWDKVELALASDVSGYSSQYGTVILSGRNIEATDSAYIPALSGVQKLALKSDLDTVSAMAVSTIDGKFSTAVYANDTSKVIGHDSDFTVIYTPSSITNTAYATADTRLVAFGKEPLDWFLADNDTGAYTDWYAVAGSGLVYNSNIPVYVTASGHSHTNTDNVTARALTGYAAGVQHGGETGSGYLLANGLILTPSFTGDPINGYDWTASGSAEMTSLAGSYTGTATFTLSKYDFTASSDSMTATISYPGSAGASAVYTQNNVCVVPTAGGGGGGGIDSATCSAIASAYAESAVSGVEYTVSANSASWGGEGVDSATVSAIASSYVESGVSGKLDESAFSSVSGTFLTAVPAGYATETYVDSSVSGVISAVSSNSASWGGGIDSATCSAIASAYQVVSAIGTGSIGESAYVSKINNTKIQAWSAETARMASTAQYAHYDGKGRLISALPNSAAVSAIASSYAASAASSKQDSSAMSAYALSADVSGCIDTVSANSAAWGTQVVSSLSSAPAYGENWVTSINDMKLSAERANSAQWGRSAIFDNKGRYLSSLAASADVSGCIDTVSNNSASWAQVVTSLSGNANFYNQINSKSISSTVSYKARLDENGNSISALYNTVSAQSANWGGSALALSAGPGIRFDKVDNTLVASVDETVLWEGSARLTSYSSTLSDSLHNYKYVDIYVQPNSADLNKRGNQISRFEVVNAGETAELYFPRTESMENYHEVSEVFYVWNYNNGSDFTLKNGARWSGDTYASSITAYRGMVTKIVGVCKI